MTFTELSCELPEPAGRIIPQDPDALLYQAEVAYLTAQSERTLEAYRLKGGGGPPFVVIGKRGVRYRRADVLQWVTERRRRSTSDPSPHQAEPRSSLRGN